MRIISAAWRVLQNRARAMLPSVVVGPVRVIATRKPSRCNSVRVFRAIASATGASPLLFPGSRVLAGWWRQLAPVKPHAVWFGHLFLHLVEALVAVARTSRPDALGRLVLQSVAQVRADKCPAVGGGVGWVDAASDDPARSVGGSDGEVLRRVLGGGAG